MKILLRERQLCGLLYMYVTTAPPPFPHLTHVCLHVLCTSCHVRVVIFKIIFEILYRTLLLLVCKTSRWIPTMPKRYWTCLANESILKLHKFKKFHYFYYSSAYDFNPPPPIDSIICYMYRSLLFLIWISVCLHSIC